MNRDELAIDVARKKETAVLVVQRHAAFYARDVPTATVESICRALGDIGIDEATAALDQIQKEAAGQESTGRAPFQWTPQDEINWKREQ